MSKPPSRAAQILSYNLQKWRKIKGLSMEALANKSGIYRTGYGMIENLKVNTTVDTLQKLSTALGIQVGELLKEPKGDFPLDKKFTLKKGKKPKSDISVNKGGKSVVKSVDNNSENLTT